MFKKYRGFGLFLTFLSLFFVCTTTSSAQIKSSFEVLEGESLTRIMPTSFYFAGQSAETQLRNAAAAKIGNERHILAGMVDTSGYSTEISGKYEGFFITDSPVRFGTKLLPVGAYGFGFAAKNTIRVFDLGSRQLLSTVTFMDGEMKRPRPLQMVAVKNGIRLYKGKNFVLISPR